MDSNTHDMLEEIDWLFRKTVRKFVKERDKVNIEGILLPGFIVLNKIIQEGKQRLTDLAEELDFTSGAITTLCDKLEKRGLVQRRRDEEDRRIIWLEITDEGQSFIDKHNNLGTATYSVIFNGFSQEELEIQKEFYRRLIGNLEQFSSTISALVEENEKKASANDENRADDIELKRKSKFITY